MVLEDLGGIIFFTDPLTAHPHADDIATLLRMADMNNVMHATNPTTALALVPVLDAVARGSAAWSQKVKVRGPQPPRFSLKALNGARSQSEPENPQPNPNPNQLNPR